MLDISYREALQRHGKQALYVSFMDEATWKEVEVGTKEFWNNLSTGQLIAFESGSGIYVGIVYEHDFALENGCMWIYFTPDPTQLPLPDVQEQLPVCFGIRDKIMMEVVS